MPYTPPSSRSPATSAPPSPDASRRPSTSGTSRPALPRSASYLSRHRRTPSAMSPSNGVASQPTPQATSEDLKGMLSNHTVRQSPPPVTDERKMPTGAIISPPDSSTSSDDDDLPEMRGRRIENLKELHEAISQIPVVRQGSPQRQKSGAGGDLVITPSKGLAVAEKMHQSFSTSALDGLTRKISHTRSHTEPNVAIPKSEENSISCSEEESDMEICKKPQMVRKKSGELVRPALRPVSRRRPSSMPGTPTFSKAVHFDSQLEHVRHFLQVDRPLAVSAGSSPVDNYDSDNEFPFPGESGQAAKSPPFEWEIITTNFPADSPKRKALPVRMEKVWLSKDQKSLFGSVAVANLAFQKHVTCRFTLDYWKTTSEIMAEYCAEIRPRETPEGHDRFQFTIKLSDLANLESKTLYFCIRYNVNGQELWDNNYGTNFQVDFRKKMLPQNGKRNFQGASSRPVGGALPRSNRRVSPNLAPRPRSVAICGDEFGDKISSGLNFDQPIHEVLGEAEPGPLRLKGTKQGVILPSDNLASRLASPSGQAFANRYDFGASLSAAKQAAKNTTSKELNQAIQASFASQPASSVKPRSADKAKARSSAASGTDSPGSGSMSYDEILSKFCFYGSKQSSPQIKDGTFRSGRFDGADDNSSASNSPPSPQMNDAAYTLRHHDTAVHHSLRPRDTNPYFHNAHIVALGASPAASPLKIPVPPTAAERSASPLLSQQRTTSPASGQSTGRSPSPASMVGSFPPFAGMLLNELPFHTHHMNDRFPYSNMEAHTGTAIRS